MSNAVGNATLSFEYASHPITSAGDGDNTFDALTDHQHHNQKPKPPSTGCLCHPVVHHRLWPRQIVETYEEVDDHNNDNKVGDNNVDDDNVDNNNNVGNNNIDDDNIDNNNGVSNNYIDDNNADDNNRVDNKWGEDEMDDNDNLDNKVDDEDQEPPRKHAMMLSQPSFISIQVHGLIFLNVPSSIFVFGWLTIAHLLNMMPIIWMHNVL